jgi:hypothetical protein
MFPYRDGSQGSLIELRLRFSILFCKDVGVDQLLGNLQGGLNERHLICLSRSDELAKVQQSPFDLQGCEI